jgi:hypothetical protein
MKKTVIAAVAMLALGNAAGATAQVTGGAGSGIGSGTMNAPPANQLNTTVPTSAGLPDQSGLTAGPNTALGRSANGTGAGAYNKDDLGVNQATLPVERREPGVGFADRDIGGHGRALDSTLLGTGAGSGTADGLITGSGAQIH